jgi:formylglycine-generating enzyme required for sulfatase activity
LKGGKDPHGPSGGERVVRGGSFLSTVDQITATTRKSVSPKVANVEIGFRCAADVKSAP